MVASPFELRRWRLPVEVALWDIVVLVPRFHGCAGADAVAGGPAVGVPLDAATATLDTIASFCSITRPPSARGQQLACRRRRPSRSCVRNTARVLSVWRRSRLLRVVNLITEVPYALPRGARDRGDPAVPETIALVGVSIYNTVWIILFCTWRAFWCWACVRCIGYHQLDRNSWMKQRRSRVRPVRRLRTIILPLVAPAAARVRCSFS